MRIAVLAAAACLSIVGLASADDAKASIRMPTQIPAQSLREALKTLAQARDLQVLYFSESVRDIRTGGAVGELTTDEALKQLLSGTGLTYRYVSDKAITILPVSEAAAGGAAPAQPASSPANSTTGDAQREGKKGSSDTFRLAQTDQGATAGSSALGKVTQSPEKNSASKVVLEEVVVTAQKRQERLQDVPVPVTAIKAEMLVDRNQLQLQDYYSSIPALSMTVNDLGAPQIAIRGLTTGGYTSSTVGVVIDDVPYGSSSPAAYGEEAPDLDPSDLARVEVLRGPQGTLYGASSLGGLLKYVTVDPSTDGFSGRVQAGPDSVRNSGSLGYSLRASGNAPLSDTLALRVSGFYRRDAGYIDDPMLHTLGVNEGHSDGARLALLWKPSETFSLKLGALFQRSAANGVSTIALEPGFSDLQQSYVRGAGAYDKSIQAYSAIATARLGRFDFTSITGYNINTLDDSTDYTPFYSSYIQTLFGVTGALYQEHFRTTKFTQEIRASTQLGTKIEWLLGVFYDHESTPPAPGIVYAVDPPVGVPVGEFVDFIIPSTYSERAVFTDLTLHLTDRFDVQLGGRESENRQKGGFTITGPYVPIFLPGQTSPFVYPDIYAKENAFTYLVTPRLKISPDVMLYARFASGYRPGGPNLGANSATQTLGLPTTYKRDTTLNYELGIKGEVLNHTLSVDGSVYYIDWKDIQLQLLDPVSGITYYANGSRAKSQGVEVSVISRPVRGLTISAWGAWNQAELTDSFPQDSFAVGAPGDRLPFSSRFSGNASVEERFFLADRLDASVGATISYVGEREGVFGNIYAPDRQTYPSYSKTDLHAELTRASWKFILFVNNVTDKRGLIGGGIGAFNPTEFNIIQPRTFGVSAGKTF